MTTASRRYPADPAIAGSARAFVSDHLERLALTERADDAVLLAGELVTNAILHARTGFEVRVRPVQDGARVEVLDDSPTLPVAGSLDAGALSGRGLRLVQSLSRRWGAHPGPPPGKTVWFELASVAPEPPSDEELDALLSLWEDEGSDPSPTRAQQLVEVVVPDMPVQPLLAAKVHMEDLLRELQLTLLDRRPVSGDPPYPAHLLQLAERLDSAARDFGEGRRQCRSQALAAAARGEELVTLRLSLPRTAGEAAARYRAAVNEAALLADVDGALASAASLQDHSQIRNRYLDRVIDELADSA